MLLNYQAAEIMQSEAFWLGYWLAIRLLTVSAASINCSGKVKDRHFGINAHKIAIYLDSDYRRQCAFYVCVLIH